MTLERALGWCGLFLIGLIGAAYRVHDWVVGAPPPEHSKHAPIATPPSSSPR